MSFYSLFLKRRATSRVAFTIIELLVVVAIIGIIASLTTVFMNNAKSKGRDTKRIGDIRAVQSALEMYKNDNGAYPSVITAGNTLVGPNSITYMQKIPAPPGTADGSCTSDTYTYASASPYDVYSLAYCLGQVVSTAGPADCIAKPGNICAGPAVGDSYGGGIVAYILQVADVGYVAGQTHGIIAASSDQSASSAWGCSGTAITSGNGANSQAIGGGQANTTAIITDCATAGIAARLCDDLVSGGYSDWYLPSHAEMLKLYLLKVAGLGGFTSGMYWGSYETAIDGGGITNFNGGGQGNYPKNSGYNVRCARSF